MCYDIFSAEMPLVIIRINFNEIQEEGTWKVDLQFLILEMVPKSSQQVILILPSELQVAMAFITHLPVQDL